MKSIEDHPRQAAAGAAAASAATPVGSGVQGTGAGPSVGVSVVGQEAAAAVGTGPSTDPGLTQFALRMLSEVGGSGAAGELAAQPDLQQRAQDMAATIPDLLQECVNSQEVGGIGNGGSGSKNPKPDADNLSAGLLTR